MDLYLKVAEHSWVSLGASQTIKPRIPTNSFPSIAHYHSIPLPSNPDAISYSLSYIPLTSPLNPPPNPLPHIANQALILLAHKEQPAMRAHLVHIPHKHSYPAGIALAVDAGGKHAEFLVAFWFFG